MSITAAVVGGVAAGAAGGLSSYFGNKGKGADFKYDYHPLDESLKQSSQYLIPIYMKLLTGGVPNFLQRYLSQAESAAVNKANQAAQNYLRAAGKKSSSFGPQQMEALSKIYQGVTPSIISAMNQVRSSGLERAFQGTQQWSQMRPQQTGTREVQPGMGPQAAAGALQGLQYGMGQMMQGGAQGAGTAPKPNIAATPITTSPPVQQSLQTMNPYMPNAVNDLYRQYNMMPGQNPYQKLYR